MKYQRKLRKIKKVSNSDIDLEAAKAIIENEVYAASYLFEELENIKIYGNAHHIRQKIAAYAGKLMEERWTEK